MADIDAQIALFEQKRADFEAHSMGKWVLIHEDDVALYDSFEQAASDATAKFGRGPFLIRQVGAPPVTLPASVAYFQSA